MTLQALRLVVADDERPARRFLASMLKNCPGVHLVGEASSGLEAISLIHAQQPHLALLDLQMPDVGGLDVVRRLTSKALPLVAFVVAFDSHAIEILESNAIDYLVKPVQKERLDATLDRARQCLERGEPAERQATALARAATAFAVRRPYVDRLPLRQRNRIVIVPVRTIASIEADGEVVRVRTATNTYTVYHRLTALEARLDPRYFIRLSRGTIVNVEMIAEVRLLRGGTCVAVLGNGQELSVSRIHAKVLRSTVLKL